MDYRWIAQDACGTICSYTDRPVTGLGYGVWSFTAGRSKDHTNGVGNPNWKDSLIDLEEEDFEVVDGVLFRKPKSKKELTDTELLDAIEERDLIVAKAYDGRAVVYENGGGGTDAVNRKGDIRKAIKKWLRKNVDKKEIKE